MPPPAAAAVTAGDLVRRGLRALGVEAVYGLPLPGVPVVDVEDAGLALLFAEAHLLVHRGRCAVHAGEGELLVLDRAAAWTPAGPGASGRSGPAGGTGPPGGPGVAAASHAPGADAALIAVEDADGLLAVWRAAEEHLRPAAAAPASVSAPVPASLPTAPTGGAVRVRLGLDAAAPVPDRLPAAPEPADRWVPPPDTVVEAAAAALAPVLLVGPGVAEPALVPGLHALAAGASLGVLNTWGAKGVFDWRSRHHWATVGLQADDFARGGLAGADLILAAGLDPREAPDPRWRLAPVVELAPGSLGPLAERWGRSRVELAMPALRQGLAAATQEGWAVDGPPLPPSRVTRTYAQVVGAGGLVAADPGTAGYWVARTFATTGLGGAVVPARAGAAGLAAAAVAVARLRQPGRPALAVVDAHAGAVPAGAGDASAGAGATAAVVAAAARLGVPVPVERWDPDGPALAADAHAERLRSVVAAERSSDVAVATDPTQLAKMVAVAGDIVAWRRAGSAHDAHESRGIADE